MGPSRSLVIDTDTASDDAIALLLAVRHPEVSIRAITIVAGNVSLAQASRNACVTFEVAGLTDVAVYLGCAKPLVRELVTAPEVHGPDGMSGTVFADPLLQPQGRDAVSALLGIAATEPDRHDLVTLGPLTNIATALAIDPELLTKFRHTYLMLGASDGRGNVSPTAEFNAYVDPEAVSIVLVAPGAKTLIGWDVSRKYAVMDAADDAALRALGRLGAFASDISRSVLAYCTNTTGIAGYDLPDPVAMAVALDPRLVADRETSGLRVSLEAATRGQIVVDPNGVDSAEVVTAVDASRFKSMLFELLATTEPG